MSLKPREKSVSRSGIVDVFMKSSFSGMQRDPWPAWKHVRA